MKKKGRSRKAACQGPGVKAWQCGRAASGCSERLRLNSQWRQSRASGWRFISRAVLCSNLALHGSERLGSCGGCSLLFANRASWLSKGGLFELGWGVPLLTTVARVCWLGEGPRTESPQTTCPTPELYLSAGGGLFWVLRCMCGPGWLRWLLCKERGSAYLVASDRRRNKEPLAYGQRSLSLVALGSQL